MLGSVLLTAYMEIHEGLSSVAMYSVLLSLLSYVAHILRLQWVCHQDAILGYMFMADNSGKETDLRLARTGSKVAPS